MIILKQRRMKMQLSKEVQQQIATQALKQVILICELHGINYIELTQKQKDHILDLFHGGIKFGLEQVIV